MDRNHYFDGEFSVVEDDDENGTYALANPDGEVVSEYYECIEPFDENHVIVHNEDGNVALLLKDGTVLTDWYDDIRPFHEGFAVVENEYEHAVINLKGELISDWYYEINAFYEGYAIVENDDQYSLMDSTGKLVCPWDYEVKTVRNLRNLKNTGKERTVAALFTNTTTTHLFKETETSENMFLLSHTDLDKTPRPCFDEDDNTSVFGIKEKIKNIKKAANSLFSETTTERHEVTMHGTVAADESYMSGRFAIKTNEDDEKALMDVNGKVVSDYYYSIEELDDNHVLVQRDDEYWAVMDINGKIVSDWYFEISDNKDGTLAVTREDDAVALINVDGAFLTEWYNSIDNWNDDYKVLETADNQYLLFSIKDRIVGEPYKDKSIFMLKDDLETIRRRFTDGDNGESIAAIADRLDMCFDRIKDSTDDEYPLIVNEVKEHISKLHKFALGEERFQRKVYSLENDVKTSAYFSRRTNKVKTEKKYGEVKQKGSSSKSLKKILMVIMGAVLGFVFLILFLIVLLIIL